MGVSATAAFFVEIESPADLKEALQFAQSRNLSFRVLGEGSNQLFVNDFDGLIIKNEIKGIETVREDEDRILLKIGAGENWHDLVLYCVQKRWGGIENLALIPGTVGAAPVQNIGAYGAELRDVFVELEAFMVETGEVQTLSKKECKFSYRESIFKQGLKDKAVILNVTLGLQKNQTPQFGYKALLDYLESRGIQKPDMQQVCEAVVAVRESKLPNPAKIGNNGSFFKNPVISVFQFDELKQEYPDLPCYPVTEHLVKVPAGWLIEKAGWKGFREGDAGVYPKQALILVNYGNATGQEILQLAQHVLVDVHKKFGIELTPEVNII